MKLASRLLAPVNTTVISILGLGQLLMGVWLVMPFQSLSFYQPEWTAGIIIGLIGFFIARFSLRGDLQLLQYITSVAYIFWFASTVVMLIMATQTLGWVVGLIFAAYCFMINLNIRVNRREIK